MTSDDVLLRLMASPKKYEGLRVLGPGRGAAAIGPMSAALQTQRLGEPREALGNQMLLRACWPRPCAAAATFNWSLEGRPWYRESNLQPDMGKLK